MVPFLPWLRLNLALLVLATGMISGTFGALITTVSFVGDMKHLVADRGITLASHTKDLASLHTDMANVDHRLNEAKAAAVEQRRLRDNQLSEARAVVEEQRRVRDNQVAILEQRTALLEEQLRFFAPRVPPALIGNHR
jgi:hypothetical protein